MGHKTFIALFALLTGSVAEVRAQRKFTHPGILHTRASLAHISSVAKNENMPGFGSYKFWSSAM